MWEFCSFHSKENDFPLQRLLKEYKRDLMMSLPTFFIVFHQFCIFLKDNKTHCHISEKKAYWLDFCLTLYFNVFIFEEEWDLDEIFFRDFTSCNQNQHTRDFHYLLG